MGDGGMAVHKVKIGIAADRVLPWNLQTSIKDSGAA